MCHLGQGTVSRYLIKCYSRCFCKGSFKVRLTLNSEDWTRLSSTIWVAFIQSAEGLNRKQTNQPKHWSHPRKGFHPQAAFPHHWNISSSLCLGLQAYPADFGHASLLNHMNQFLKINLVLSCLFSSFYLSLPTQRPSSFSLENLNTGWVLSTLFWVTFGGPQYLSASLY